MGEEADYLESQSDEGASDDMYWSYIERARKQKADRRAFKSAVQSEVQKHLKRNGIEPKKYEVRGKMIDRVCFCGCGKKFQAREADVKRGWGKFSSKACAAKFKDRSTRGRNRDHYGT